MLMKKLKLSKDSYPWYKFYGDVPTHIDYPDGSWRNKNGAPTKAQIVKEWKQLHPEGTKADCIRETGLTKPTVYKWW